MYNKEISSARNLLKQFNITRTQRADVIKDRDVLLKA